MADAGWPSQFFAGFIMSDSGEPGEVWRENGMSSDPIIIRSGVVLHFWNFGSDNKTACKLPVWMNCATPQCNDCAHKVNPCTMWLDDVQCRKCKMAALKQFGIDAVAANA